MQIAAVAPNVTFPDVQALEYNMPDASIAYGNANPDLQKGLLWLPGESPQGNAPPLVIFVHGGCWLNSFDITHTYAFTSALAQAGYAVWSLEYRRTGDAGGGWPGTFEDVLAGIDWRKQLVDYPVDTERFVLMGHSAGGHLALLAGNRMPEAQAVIGLAPIANLVEYALGANSCQAVTTRFMGATPDAAPQLYAQADPSQQQLHNNTYLLEGTLDDIVPLTSAPIHGTNSLIAQGAGHMDWVHPGTPAFAQLIQLLASVFQN